jgi:DNA-binding transcriptional regulator YdaS (Cro superfamily)
MKQEVSVCDKGGCNVLQPVVSVVAMNEVSDSIAKATADAKAAAGGPSALARGLSESGEMISSQAVSKWAQVPAERVLEVERLSGVSRYRLRPDVFGVFPDIGEAGQPDGAAA